MRRILPRGVTEKPETEPLPLPVKPRRPSLVTTAQHGAPWCVSTALLTTARSPPLPRMYDDAEPGAAASDTSSTSCWPNAKPNGVPPAEVNEVRAPAAPFASTAYTYSRLRCTVTLIGSVPPEAVRLASVSSAPRAANTDTSLEPALTANSQRPSSLSATAPCEPSAAPVPVPPVATVPAATSVPSAARSKTATALPAT